MTASAAPIRVHGTGMVGMYERASLLSGELIFDSPPGGPTRILVDIPRPR